MANLIETPKWEDGIYRIELTDPRGGTFLKIWNRPVSVK